MISSVADAAGVVGARGDVGTCAGSCRRRGGSELNWLTEKTGVVRSGRL